MQALRNVSKLPYAQQQVSINTPSNLLTIRCFHVPRKGRKSTVHGIFQTKFDASILNHWYLFDCWRNEHIIYTPPSGLLLLKHMQLTYSNGSFYHIFVMAIMTLEFFLTNLGPEEHQCFLSKREGIEDPLKDDFFVIDTISDKTWSQ